MFAVAFPKGCHVFPQCFHLRILKISSCVVSQTQTSWSSFSPSSTTLFLPVCVTRNPKIWKTFPACSEIFFVSRSFTRAFSTANLVAALSSRSSRISWVAASSCSSSLRLISVFSLTFSAILFILASQSMRFLAFTSSCRRRRRFLVHRVEIFLPSAICGTSTSSHEGFSTPILLVIFVLQTHSTCLVGGNRSCGLGAPGCSSHGLLLAARTVGPIFV